MFCTKIARILKVNDWYLVNAGSNPDPDPVLYFQIRPKNLDPQIWSTQIKQVIFPEVHRAHGKNPPLSEEVIEFFLNIFCREIFLAKHGAGSHDNNSS